MRNLLVIMAILGVMTIAQAEDTVSSKATETAHDVKRSAKKGLHRVQEATCTEGDLKCAGKKAGNRVKEGADYTKDKVNEATDKK
ncbi:MAG TPA: hypothetical protein VF412_14880 [Bdellovibrio sp.]|uniref:hypothetical protein n=1 Tax=Bdellovibrio sp. TaxID=28201 RepID=UPI002EF8673F